MRFSRLGALCLALALWFAPAAWAEVPVPPLKARVTDLTGTLSAAQRSSLESDLQGLEARSGSQLAVLLVPTTQPEAIEQYSLRVVEAWKLGQKGKDNGLLLLVAKNDRKLRIEVGYGLEGTIPDAIAKRVIDDTITPHFKQGDYAGGIAAGVQRLAGVIEGRAEAGKTDTLAGEQSSALSKNPIDAAAKNKTVGERLIDNAGESPALLLIFLVVAGTALRWFIGPLFGGLAMGGMMGAVAWLLYGALEITLVAGFVGFIFVLVGLANWIGFALSASSGGGSGSSGGFSGGGGSFGGGGASGSW